MSNFKYVLQRNREEMLPFFLWLASINDLGIRRYKRMQSFFATPKDLYMADYSLWEKTGVFSKKQLEKMETAKREGNLYEAYDNMRSLGIELISFDDEGYPEQLKEIPSPPVFLFKKGELKPLATPVVSVIGARECSPYGSRVAARIGELLAINGITLVSGMARGIDSLSQEACIDAGGYTVGILGGGPDICYPRDCMRLYSKLERQGCILSEYAPGINPQPQFFACRNRIISGLADVICVIEAREKSGTMITVDAALEQGREVYALPGRITDLTSAGCNDLIRQGAGMITDPEAFVQELINNYSMKRERDSYKIMVPTEENFEKTLELGETERKIIAFSSDDSFTFEEISIRSGITPAEALTSCMGLSGKLLLQNMGAGRFCMTDAGMRVRNNL